MVVLMNGDQTDKMYSRFKWIFAYESIVIKNKP